MLSLKKMLKNFLIIGILISVFFGAGFSLAVAFNLISPQGSNVPPNSYFQWQSAGVDIYGVNLRTPGQSWVEHKIKASESNFCNPQNCSFPFLDQGIASEINYGGTYTWKVIAYDTSGTAIGSSNEMTFTVQGPPTAPPPPPTSGGSSEIKSPIAAVSVDELFKTIINFLFYLSMGIAPVMIIYAAFLMLTSAGKPEQTSKAKTIILWTLVATAVILFAKGLPAVIKGALGG